MNAIYGIAAFAAAIACFVRMVNGYFLPRLGLSTLGTSENLHARAMRVDLYETILIPFAAAIVCVATVVLACFACTGTMNGHERWSCILAVLVNALILVIGTVARFDRKEILSSIIVFQSEASEGHWMIPKPRGNDGQPLVH